MFVPKSTVGWGKPGIAMVCRGWWSALRAQAPTLLRVGCLGVVMVILASKGLTDEGVVSFQGDMPRYVMNGVYFYDIMRDFPLDNFFQYSNEYYARYPALSLGHHPFVISAAAVPFFYLFGISIYSAKLATISFFLLAGIAWFFFIRLAFDEEIAFHSTLLFVTTSFIVDFARVVMSEVSALAFIIVSAYWFFRFVKDENPKFAWAFGLTVTLSLYAKHVAIFMLPVFALYWVMTKGPKKVLDKTVLLTGLGILVMVSPLVFITLEFGSGNVSWAATVVEHQLQAGLGFTTEIFPLKLIWRDHLSWPVILVSVGLMANVLWRRDTRFVFFFLWILILYVFCFLVGPHQSRFGIYWIPVFCLFAAMLPSLVPYRWWKIVASLGIFILAGYQFVYAYQKDPTRAAGYEQAAQFVVENWKGSTVLFSSHLDSGYFVFFVRKLDPRQSIIVLRADKMLGTAQMNRLIEEKVTRPEEIYPILDSYGTCYVVVEEKRAIFRSIQLLQDEVKTDRFILRKRIHVDTNYPKLLGLTLGVYEYKGCGPPTEGITLDLWLPLVGRRIGVHLSDLLKVES